MRVIAPWITPHSTNRRARRSPYRKHAPPIAFLTQIKDARCGDGGEVFDATIEVPVTIRKPDKPIGTHVFTAMARNDAGLRWTAVTIDNGDDAKDALDRITIPQHVLDRIAPTALPRSSIIVSDEPLSRETNYRTEFVAVLNNQPQGGFLSAGLRSMSPLRGELLGQRRLRLLFPAQLELATCQYASARRAILSTDATALVVTRGTPRVGRMVAQGQDRRFKRKSRTTASLIGHSRSSAFRLSAAAVSMSLTGSCFSSESAPRPFHHGIRERGGTIFSAALPSDLRRVQAEVRTHLIHRPARDIIPPLGGARVSSYRM